MRTEVTRPVLEGKAGARLATTPTRNPSSRRRCSSVGSPTSVRHWYQGEFRSKGHSTLLRNGGSKPHRLRGSWSGPAEGGKKPGKIGSSRKASTRRGGPPPRPPACPPPSRG